MVPMALLIVHWWDQFRNKKPLILVGSIFPVLVVIALVAFVSNDSIRGKINSDKYLLANQTLSKEANVLPIYYWNKKSYSGQFYTDGKAKTIRDSRAFDSVLELSNKLFLIITKKRLKDIPETIKPHLELLDSNYKTSIFLVEK